MHKERSRKNVAPPTPKRFARLRASWAVKLGLVLLPLAGSVGFFASQPQSAQQRFREQAVKVTGIASNGGSYTITADGPLTRAQTYQSGDWFYVVVVNGQTDLGRGAPGGVRLERISDSLEIRVPVKPGASVTVNPRGNRLDLVVEGGSNVAESRAERVAPQTAAPPQQSAEREQASQTAATTRAEREAARRAARAEQLMTEPLTATKRPQAAEATTTNAPATSSSTSLVNAPANTPAGQDSDVRPIDVGAQASAQNNSNEPPPPPAQALQPEAGEGGGLLGIIFSATTLIVLLVVGAVAGVVFVFLRRRKEDEGGASTKSVKDARATAAKARGEEKSEQKSGESEATLPAFEQSKGDRRKESVPVSQERRTTGRGAEDEATRHQRKPGALDTSANGDGERKSETRANLPSVVFGAYRIEQEVAQLVRGGPHSIEVLASRAADDRRAVETFLMKALNSPETDEDGRRRVQTAFEDYGFVARQNAALLLAPNSYERTAAARTLGEMQSAQALPFLTEALYDTDTVVRTEAVKSLGSLGLPSSIGAMLDAGRRHPDIPAAVLGPALTACSVETVEAMGGICEEGVPLAQALSAEQFVQEMRGAEPPRVRELPEWLEDETLLGALDRLQSADVEARIVATQSLAKFQVRRAVEALAAMSLRDESPAVRAAAVTALGSIDHESVFAPVLVAMADESREVRAAAARTMSRLGFERADAFMHVTETADRPTLREAARACVASGLAAQAVGRLTSEDRRQAFEAFSVLALVVKGGEAQVILDAVEHHGDIEVRLAAVHVLGLMDDPDLASRLEMIARRGGLPVPLHAAIGEVAARAVRVRPEVFGS